MTETESKTRAEATLAALIYELEGLRAVDADASGLASRSLAELLRLTERVAKLERAIEGLRRQLAEMIRSPKPEGFDESQMLLGYPEPVVPEILRAAEGAEERDDGSSTKEKRRKPRRKRLQSEDWSRHPRERREHMPPPEERVCCGQEMERVGEVVRETRERRPATFMVIEDVTVQLRCGCCGREAQATHPPQALEHRGHGPMLLASIITSKFDDHIPLNRLAGMFAREGQPIAKSTLCDDVARVAEEFRPIVREMRLRVLEQPVIQCDETGILVCDRDAPGGSRKGYIRVYRAPLGAAVFEFTPTKEGHWARDFLIDYRGYLQADAASTFDEIFASGRIREVGCNAHAMRKFRDLLEYAPPEVERALLFYKTIYDIEREATERGVTTDERRTIRQERTRPVVEEFYTWLEALAPTLLPSNPLRKAINYSLNHRVALTRFLEDGNLRLDNNDAERALRQVAVGRKNWEFAGSEAGAHRAATLYSIVVSCKELGVDPSEYIADVLMRLGTTPAHLVHELTPLGWKAARDAAQVSPSAGDDAVARPPDEVT